MAKRTILETSLDRELANCMLKVRKILKDVKRFTSQLSIPIESWEMTKLSLDSGAVFVLKEKKVRRK